MKTKLLLLCMFLMSWILSGCFHQQQRILKLPGVRQITPDGVYLLQPSWSSDSTHLAAVTPSGAAEGPITGAVYVIDVKNGEAIQVAPKTGKEYHIYDPTWSFDNSEIAYGAGGIWMTNVESRESRQIADTNYAALSPVQNQLALFGPLNSDLAAANRPSKLSILDLTTSEERIVTTIDGWYHSIQGISWSRDGQEIAFALSVTKNPPNCWHTGDPPQLICSEDSYKGTLYTIYVIDVKSGELKQLLEAPNANLEYPTWSPDGRFVAYSEGIEFGKYHLWVVNADGSCPVQLLDVDGINSPSWSPDGGYIAFEYDGGLYTFDLKNEEATQRMKRLNCK